MEKARVTSQVTRLPASCKAAQERAAQIMREEDAAEKSGRFRVAELPAEGVEKIRECERELNSHGYWNITLVAYQKEE